MAGVLDGGDSEAVMAVEQAGTEGEGADLSVTGDRCVAVDDDVTVGDEVVRSGLCR